MRSSRAGLGGRRLRHDQLAVDLGELLLVHQPAAGVDDVVLGLEIDHGALCAAGLVAQFLDAILQPDAGAARGLVLRLELVDDIGIGDRVGDLRGLDRGRAS